MLLKIYNWSGSNSKLIPGFLDISLHGFNKTIYLGEEVHDSYAGGAERGPG